ncbi:hypothetical protein DL95DRAFT_396951, partial [Leptodontidium sp. 2 PMI_412]
MRTTLRSGICSATLLGTQIVQPLSSYRVAPQQPRFTVNFAPDNCLRIIRYLFAMWIPSVMIYLSDYQSLI